MQGFQPTFFTRQNRNHRRFTRLRKKGVNLFDVKPPIEFGMGGER